MSQPCLSRGLVYLQTGSAKEPFWQNAVNNGLNLQLGSLVGKYGKLVAIFKNKDEETENTENIESSDWWLFLSMLVHEQV